MSLSHGPGHNGIYQKIVEHEGHGYTTALQCINIIARAIQQILGNVS
jgi:hypothetical protein